jgi:hypothetical protein
LLFQIPDCPGTTPLAINDDFVIVGRCSNSPTLAGFIRNAFGQVTLLPGLFPTGINIHSEITGFANGPDLQSVGFIRSPGGQLTTFSANIGNTVPLAINALGQVAGYSFSALGEGGFLRNPDGTIIFGFPGPGFQGGRLLDINDRGDMAGLASGTGTFPKPSCLSPMGDR